MKRLHVHVSVDELAARAKAAGESVLIVAALKSAGCCG